jgi:hypothetical protein
MPEYKEIIVEDDLEIEIDYEENTIEEPTIADELTKIKSSHDFTNDIIFANIKDIREIIEDGKLDHQATSQLLQKMFGNLKSELDERSSQFNESLTHVCSSFNQKIQEERAFFTGDLTEHEIRLKTTTDDFQKTIADLRESQKKTVEEIIGNISKLEAIVEAAQQTVLAVDSKASDVFGRQIPNLEQKIAQNARKTLETINDLSESMKTISRHQSEELINKTTALEDIYRSFVKTTELQMGSLVKTEDFREFERFLDLHIGEVLNESLQNKEQIALLETNLESVNRLLLEKIQSADDNSRIKTRQINESLKNILNTNVESLKKRFELSESELDEMKDRLRRLESKDGKILVESVTNKISDQYVFKLKQLRDSVQERFKKLETMFRGVQDQIKKQKPDFEFRIDRSALKDVVEEYFVEHENDFNSTPEHKLEGGFLFFRQPDGRWGHGIRVDYSSFVTGGFSYSSDGLGQLTIYEDGVAVHTQTNKINFTGAVETSYDSVSGMVNVNILGSTGSGIVVEDEGVEVGTADTINFVGAGVIAKTGANKINVYVPPPTYSPEFNTGASSISGIVGTSRNVAAPTGNYLIGDWTAGTKHPCINSGSLVYETPVKYSFESLESSLTVAVKNATGITVMTSTIILDENSDTTNNNIRVINTEFGSEYDRYCIKSRVEINLDPVLTAGGRFSVTITQNNPTMDDYTFTQTDLFYDKQSSAASLSSPSLSIQSGVTKYLSGVQYYTTGTQVSVTIGDIDNLNDKSYPDTQVEIVGAELGLSQLSLTGANLTGWTNSWDDTNDSYSKSDWSISTGNLFVQSSTANCAARTNDWAAGAWVNGNDLAVLIDTYSDNSTRIYEDFRSETYRLKSDLTAWDSTQNITSYDDALGLQVKNSRLIYPTENFQSYNPGTLSQPNYVGAAGSRTYFRRMWSAGTTYSNGTLTFAGTGLTENNFWTLQKMKLQWSVDGTNWFAMNVEYAGGVLTPGAGSRVNRDTVNLDAGAKQIAFTLGEGLFSTEIWFKIELTDATISVDSISLNWT